MSETARVIEQKVNAARLTEAGTLIQVHKHSLSQQEQIRLQQLVDERMRRAAQLVKEAKAAEFGGRTDQALELFRSASRIVRDDPEIQAKLSELEDAVNLAGALKKRVERREPPIGERKTTVSRKKIIFMGLAGLLLGISAGWFLTGKPTIQITVSNAVKEPRPESPQPLPAERQQGALPEPTAAEKAAFPVKGRLPQTIPAEQGASLQAPPVEPARPRPKVEKTTAGQPERLSRATLPAQIPSPEVNVATAEPTYLGDDSQARYYTVQPGDSLSTLASRLFCNEPAWEILHRMNADIIQNPDFILPGTRIRLQTATDSVEDKCPADASPAGKNRPNDG